MAARFPDWTTLGLVLALLLLPFVLPAVSLASEIVVFATGTLSCTFLLGTVGLLSFGEGVFFGTGAYATGLLLSDARLDMLPAMLGAVLLGAIGAAVLGALVVRRRGVTFVMLTLALAQMGYFAMLALPNVTGGENGFSDVPKRPLLAGIGMPSGPWATYALIAVLAGLAVIATQRVLASPFGTVLVAIRENERRAEALGYNAMHYKLAAFAFAGALAGLAGAMHTVFLGFVPPSDLGLELSERLVIMAIIGGVGSPAGALLGAALYTLLGEFLTPVWPRWMIIMALLLIAIVLFLRGGLWGGLSSAPQALRRLTPSARRQIDDA